MAKLSQIFAFTVLAAATLTGGVPAKRQTGQTHVGDVTFYNPGIGVCGLVNTATDRVVAVDSFLSSPTAPPSTDPLCGKNITVTYQGRTITVIVADRCASCAEFDLALSPAAFSDLAPLSLGRIHAQWVFD
ncbi:RlpA-like double-psi beta-barrel-protein domain-containing protein-containing protein [Irpex lacteus]|nr:RlpA-like double-psi beta-barrel-protein domain-containing protein-containing protein [Irpex lacteus]